MYVADGNLNIDAVRAIHETILAVYKEGQKTRNEVKMGLQGHRQTQIQTDTEQRTWVQDRITEALVHAKEEVVRIIAEKRREITEEIENEGQARNAMIFEVVSYFM